MSKKIQTLFRFKYLLLLVAVLTVASCASTNTRKCNGVRGHRVPMGVL